MRVLITILLRLFGMWPTEEVFYMFTNRYLKLFITVVLVVSLVACTNTNNDIYIQTKEDYELIFQDVSDRIVVNDDWILFVLGEKTDVPVVVVNEYSNTFVCVPILSVMNYLGAKIIDKENVYEIKFNGKKVKIDFDKKIVHTEDSELNLLGLPTGGKVFYKFIGNDVISCGPSLTCVLSFLNLDVGYHIYNDSKTIKIELI